MDIKSIHWVVCAMTLMVGLGSGQEGCFPSKYWMSCLINSCKFGGKCPSDPSATCKMEKTPCNGCKPVWHTQAGEVANCSSRQDLRLCPKGEPVVHCKLDSCNWPCDHPDFRGVKCRQSICGECKAEYLIKDEWVRCPKSSAGVNGEILPIDRVMGDICVQVPCAIEVCIGQRCPAVPRAVCRPDDCNTCKPAWYLDNQPVDCVTGEIDQRPIVNRKLQVAPWQRTCAPGEPLTPCDHRVCEKKLCRNFPDAVCRPDGCGGCADTWFLDNKLVDCLSDACPPGVPIVKCVDDPCKYFSHYCPSAECRASECGSCEAKFFSNGQEIDCAMPPKTCPAGVEARSCPWYTCPADICPTNRRLMCRIDPCDAFCKYDFIDIYTGEPMPCRVFDGDGSQKRQREEQQRAQAEVRQVADISVGAQPSLRGLVDTKVAEISVKPDILTGGMQPVGRMVVDNGIKAEPILQNAGPPITDPDILSLLRSFPHEMMIVPTASIQSALQNGKDIIATAEAAIKSQVKSENKLLGVPQQLPTFAKQPVEAPKPVIIDVVKEKAVSKPVVVDVVKEKAVASVVPHVIPPIPPKEQVITAGKTQIIVAGPSDGIYPELGLIKPQMPLGPSSFLTSSSHHNAPIKQETQMPPSTVPEVKPISPVIPWASAAVSAPASKSNGNGDRQGVPISMNLFQKWSVN